MEEKVFFNPGNLVTLNKDIPNKPIMYVVGKKTTTFRGVDKMSAGEDFLRGIICRWFTADGHMEEACFNTKDLMSV